MVLLRVFHRCLILEIRVSKEELWAEEGFKCLLSLDVIPKKATTLR